MRYLLLYLFSGIILIACDSSTPSQMNQEVTPTTKEPSAYNMPEELKQLVLTGDPMTYYHWNGKQAALHLQNMEKGSMQQQMNSWFEYCKQSLNAGNYQVCIDEISGYLNQSQKPYEEIINAKTKVLFEALALAYLRQGEQENCQNNHTNQSCIVPIQKMGQHQLKSGSENAIQIYSLLQDHFPNDKYKWLLNVAYMTLGQYPNQVPKDYKIDFPHASEQNNFPAFEDIAMSIGLAQNGLSGGTCIDDFNNDGFLDVFATSYGMEDNVQLFLNDQNGGFSNVTQKAGLQGIVSGLNCIHADYDNDGYTDILVLRGAWLGKAGTHPNSLLKNMGDGTFKDVTQSAGILSFHPTQTASWGDFDRDGDLDLFIGNESGKNDPHPCELFQNNGNGTFNEVSNQYGLPNITGFVKGVTWGDINSDGWIDLYISVLGGENMLFKNTEGQFSNITSSAGVGEPFFSFPCWFWDVNNDGHQDLFVSGYDLRYLEDVAGEYAKEMQGLPFESEKPRLYLNNGDETFTETTEDFKISKSMFAMGANFGDLDNDGFLDFYVGTGAPDFSTIVPNRMFRNMAGKKFEEVTTAGHFGHIQKGHGVAFADLDRDGDQDIYTVLGGAYEGDVFTNVLFENPISKNNWIVIQLEGIESNKSAVGTRIALTLDSGQKIYRTVSTGGTFGASPLQQEIGLGTAQKIQQLTIYWSNSKPQVFYDINGHQKIRIREGKEQIQVEDYTTIPFRKDAVHYHH
ncbi:CRTAC1 family protein [bacterium SCSIO 12643]|nr:CRTAC1 family protein [bacterium SCSIO 12643]